MGDLGSIPVLGRSPGEGIGYPLQYSGLENSMDRGAWQATVHGVSKSQARLSDFRFFFHISFRVVTLCLIHYAYHIVIFQWMNRWVKDERIHRVVRKHLSFHMYSLLPLP